MTLIPRSTVYLFAAALCVVGCSSNGSMDPGCDETGTCPNECTGTMRDCKNGAADGCETDVSNDVKNCGACANQCPLPPHGEAVCTSGTCGVSACEDSYGDCNADAGDGCESNIATDSNNCGSCGNKCPAGTNGSVSCVASTCTLACNAPYADCNGDASDGCETNLDSDLQHCGACDSACPINASSCASHACVVPQQCPNGDGLYCGGNGNSGVSSTLYQCTNGAFSVSATCSQSCVAVGSGGADYCTSATGCTISAMTYASGAQNSSNSCQQCLPGNSTTDWSNAANGTSCDIGEICVSGNCQSSCDIGGTIYDYIDANPANECQYCDPQTTTTGWTTLSDGSTCSIGTCTAGTCVADPCAGVTCSNHGTCQASAGSYVCNCSSGYAGTNCQSVTYTFNFGSSPTGTAVTEYGGPTYVRGLEFHTSDTVSVVAVRVDGIPLGGSAAQLWIKSGAIDLQTSTTYALGTPYSPSSSTDTSAIFDIGSPVQLVPGTYSLAISTPDSSTGGDWSMRQIANTGQFVTSGSLTLDSVWGWYGFLSGNTASTVSIYDNTYFEIPDITLTLSQ